MIGKGKFCILLLLGLPVCAQAQITAPVWAKPDNFWFRKVVPGGHLWLKVDAAHGVKEPLFDHQRLAIELTIRTGTEYTPLTLPFADPALQFVVKYDGSNAYIQEGAMAIEFSHAGNFWRCDLQIKWDWNRVPPTDYECLSRRPAVPGQNIAASNTSAPSASPDGSWEALIENHNVVVRRAGSTPATVRLTSDGSENDAWQPGSIRWARDSKSLSAWRINAQVWLSESVTGSVKKLVNKGEWKLPATDF
ncbi:MAG: hypothetical protein ACREMA_03440 [Longimicrobiales bacterium]